MGEELRRHGHGYGHGHRRASSPPAVVVACWDVAIGGAFMVWWQMFSFIAAVDVFIRRRRCRTTGACSSQRTPRRRIRTSPGMTERMPKSKEVFGMLSILPGGGRTPRIDGQGGSVSSLHGRSRSGRRPRTDAGNITMSTGESTRRAHCLVITLNLR